MRIVDPAGKELAGGLMATLPLESGIANTRAFVLYVGAVIATVVNEVVGMEIKPPRALATPEACTVYCVEGFNATWGKIASFEPPLENTKRSAIGVLLPPAVSTTLDEVTVAALNASAAVTSISAVSGTPTAPLAGEIAADSTWPLTVRFAVAVCPVVT